MIQAGIGDELPRPDYYLSWRFEDLLFQNLSGTGTNSMELIAFKSSGNVAINICRDNSGENTHFSNRNGNDNYFIGVVDYDVGNYGFRLHGERSSALFNLSVNPNIAFASVGHFWNSSLTNADYERSVDNQLRCNVVVNTPRYIFVDHSLFGSVDTNQPPTDVIHKDNFYLGGAVNLGIDKVPSTGYSVGAYAGDNPLGGIDGNTLTSASGELAEEDKFMSDQNKWDTPITIPNALEGGASLTIDPNDLHVRQLLSFT